MERGKVPGDNLYRALGKTEEYRKNEAQLVVEAV
jgi:hypothetical protein